MWCGVSGELIEQDEASTGTPRYHCLDVNLTAASNACPHLPLGDRSVASHELVESLLTALRDAVNEGMQGSQVVAEMVRSSKILNPCGLSMQALLATPTEVRRDINDGRIQGQEQGQQVVVSCREGAIWVLEHAHFWHLRDRCSLPLVSGETPIILI